MPSTYTSNLRTEQMATGENRSTWGTKANEVFQLLEDAITKQITVAMPDSAYTLTTANGADDEARCAGITFTGTLTAARTVTIPSVDKIYFMRNQTSGGFSLVISNGSNTTTLLNGATAFIINDSNNITQTLDLIPGTNGAKVPLLNGTNTWSGVQTFTNATTSLTYTEDGAGLGPNLNIVRLSASPTVGDLLGSINYYGRNSAAENAIYGRIFASLIDPTDGSEDARLNFQTITNGALTVAAYMQAGMIVGAPTGGDKGAGSLNANSLYLNGTALGSFATATSINLTSDVTGALPIANGGTGATTAATARTALGANNASNLTSGIVPNGQLPGRLRAVGGLPSGVTDVNLVNESGFYFVTQTTANIPEAGAHGYMLQLTQANTTQDAHVQIWIKANGGTVYMRQTWYSGATPPTWQAWQRVRWLESDLDDRYLNPTNLTSAVPVSKGGTGSTTAAAARTALGLGNSATLGVGKTSGTVAAGDDDRIVNAMSKSGGTFTGIVKGPTPITGASSDQLVNIGYLASQVVFTKFYTSSPQTIVLGGSLTLAHGLSLTPKMVQMTYVCTTAEYGYSVGDNLLINIGSSSTAGSTGLYSVRVDATNVTVLMSNLYTQRADNGSAQQLTPANWNLVVRAFA